MAARKFTISCGEKVSHLGRQKVNQLAFPSSLFHSRNPFTSKEYEL